MLGGKGRGGKTDVVSASGSDTVDSVSKGIVDTMLAGTVDSELEAETQALCE